MINDLIKIRGMGKSMGKTICLDLDGVITDFENCPEGCNYSDYPSIVLSRDKCLMRKGADIFVGILKDMGFRVVIHTARVKRERNVTEKWLRDHNIAYDALIMDKPRAWLYIDDFGYRFDDWNSLLSFIYKERPTGEG